MKRILLALFAAGVANAGEPVALGHLESKGRLITIHAGETPRYTVRAKDGAVLAEQISLRELNAKFPELRRVVDGSFATWAGL